MLPIYLLAPCNTCGYDSQGTRAKGGVSVQCTVCRTMRRVPMDRPLDGPDDPYATRPSRGIPLPKGHPWRFRKAHTTGESK